MNNNITILFMAVLYKIYFLPILFQLAVVQVKLSDIRQNPNFVIFSSPRTYKQFSALEEWAWIPDEYEK